LPESRMMYNANQHLPRVAYFCMEYGLDERLPIYSGGLGILAGDYLKSAKDLELPLVGIGILWRQDYTEQYIDEEGNPYDIYPDYDFENLQDTGVMVHVRVRGEEVGCKVWLVEQYNNAPLFLLDAGFPGSRHGWITKRLYGGGNEYRIAQEIVLGIGGVRALRVLGIDVSVYHFNEGHAVFAGLELIREKMSAGASFEEAWEDIRREVVFTTHTPVEAGNEKYAHSLLQEMGAYNGLNYQQMFQLGGDPFSMTKAALRLSYIANAVSRLHEKTTLSLWHETDNIAPMTSVTNGVHVYTWQDQAISDAFAKEEDLWGPHMLAKQRLIDFVKEKTGAVLKPNVLTVGFARRATAYKRSDLIFRDTSVIGPLLKKGKLQLIFSGKAHPDDMEGKSIIKDLVNMDRQYRDNVVFIENYDMKVARYLVQGCDLWLNNPRRPMEASGTSGMKAALNGVLNLSVVDGWVAEGPRHGREGWLLEDQLEDQGNARNLDQDEKDLQALYRVLINEVMPTYYEDHSRWKKMMHSSIEMSCWRFSSARMIREYFDRLYTKAPVLAGS
jgi:starch phosphorylase